MEYNKGLNYLTQTGLAIGKVGLKDEGNDWFSLMRDKYDFNMENGFSSRNVLTGVDWVLHHLTLNPLGESFYIYFINPIHIPKVATPFNPPN